MDKFLSDYDISSIQKDARDIRAELSKIYTFYYVLSSGSATTSANPIDPIFGEPIDPFALNAVTESRKYLQFSAFIISSSKQSMFDGSGIESQEKMTIEVDSRTNLNWKAGALVMFNGKDYRVTSVDPRGLDFEERLLINMAEVT